MKPEFLYVKTYSPKTEMTQQPKMLRMTRGCHISLKKELNIILIEIVINFENF